LESKGYSNGNSAKKKSDELSFRTISNSSKYRVSTEIATDRFEAQIKNLQDPPSQQKLNKQCINSRQNTNELNNNKLKCPLISPLNKKK
jgi:hypothetical protein